MKALMDEVRFEEGGVVVHMRKSACHAAANTTASAKPLNAIVLGAFCFIFIDFS